MRERIGDAPSVQAWRRVPPDWTGSPAEWAIYWAHDKSGLGPEGPVWQFQPGYWLQVGGFIPDFVEEDVRVTINVRNSGGSAEAEAQERANEQVRELIAASRGYTHVIVDDRAALTNPFDALANARAGQSSAGGI